MSETSVRSAGLPEFQPLESRLLLDVIPVEGELKGLTVRPDGRPNPQAGDPAERSEILAPGSFGTSYVPFDKAWSAARTRAEDAVGKQKIPVRLRKLILDYHGTRPKSIRSP